MCKACSGQWLSQWILQQILSTRKHVAVPRDFTKRLFNHFYWSHPAIKCYIVTFVAKEDMFIISISTLHANGLALLVTATSVGTVKASFGPRSRRALEKLEYYCISLDNIQSGCLYDAFQYNMILHISLKWPKLKYIRVWTHERPRISRSSGQAIGCILWRFLVKNGQVITSSQCIFIWLYCDPLLKYAIHDHA